MKNLMIVFVWDSGCTIHSKVENYKKIINQTSQVRDLILNNEKIDVLVSPKVKDETVMLSITESLISRYRLDLNIPVVVDKPFFLPKDSQGSLKREVYIVFIERDEACPFISNPKSSDMAILELEMGMWNPVYAN